jgi:Outer membrane protein beta-barrel domain
MKKLTLFMFFAIVSFAVQAQSAFNADTKLLDVGVGFGSPFWGSGYKNSLPVNPRISFEKAVDEQISAGVSLAYSSSKYDYKSIGLNYAYKLKGYYISGRGAWHFKVNEKIDPYAGASAGYVIVTLSDSDGLGGVASSGFGYGIFGGARYYPKGKLGVNAELGYSSFAFLSVGASFKF